MEEGWLLRGEGCSQEGERSVGRLVVFEEYLFVGERQDLGARVRALAGKNGCPRAEKSVQFWFVFRSRSALEKKERLKRVKER